MLRFDLARAAWGNPRMSSDRLQSWYLDHVRGRRTGLSSALVRAGLWAVSLPYDLGIRMRRTCYRIGLLRTHRLPVPVISVGNLSLGGTGKTPMVALLAQHLLARGHRVAVLSRGYGRTGIRTPADASSPSGDDEGLLPEAPADRLVRLVGAARARTGRRAVEEHRATVILLDDGFQHLALARDLDLVLVDATQPLRGEGLFPSGLLRERPSALRRASEVVLTRTDQASPERAAAARAEIERITGRPPIEAVHAPAAVRNWPEPGCEGLEHVRDTRAFGFCGVGNPEAFRRTLVDCGVKLTGFRAFPDHHRFDDADRDLVSREAESSGADWLLTTAKDALRLTPDWKLASRPVRILEVRIALVRDAERLWQRVDATSGDGPEPPVGTAIPTAGDAA